MIPYALLTLRRERLGPIILALAYVWLLAVAVWAGRRMGGYWRFLDLVTWIGVFVGLPVSAPVLGASAGAGLRLQEAADEPLPISAGDRERAALGAAFAEVCGLAVIAVAGRLIVNHARFAYGNVGAVIEMWAAVVLLSLFVGFFAGRAWSALRAGSSKSRP